MKLVIEIDDKIYKEIIKKYNTFPKQMKEYGLSAIKNGKPLHPEYKGCLRRYRSR